MNNKYIRGRNLLLALDDTIVGCSKSCELVSNTEMIETSSPTSARARSFIPGRETWTLTISGLLSKNSMEEMNDLKQKALVASFIERETRQGLYGTAYITTIRFNGTLGQYSTYSIDLQGSGELLKGFPTQRYIPTSKDGVALSDSKILYTNLIK